jgi:hypothetical protein
MDNMYNTMRPRRRRPFIGCLVSLLIIGGILSFFIYKFEFGGVITMHDHPTVVVDECTGYVHVTVGTSSNQVRMQGLAGGFTSYSYNQNRNQVIIYGCNLSLQVPPTTDLILNADHIEVFGVSGKMTISANGGSIVLMHSTLQGASAIDNNGGPIIFNGALDTHSNPTISDNGGSIDMTLARSVSFHLDATGIIGGITANFPIKQSANATGDIHADIGTQPSTTLTLKSNDTSIVLESI